MKEYIIELSDNDAKSFSTLMEVYNLHGLVRCKDCVYADDFDCPAPLSTGYLCQKGHGPHLGNWFCADGERA